MNKIPEKQLKHGLRIEMQEHWWATKAQATKIVCDHIRKHPFAYRK